MKSPNTTKNNFTESATMERSTCTFKLNVRFFAKHKCVHFRITVKPLLSGHLRDPPSVCLIEGVLLIQVCKHCLMFVND